MNELDELIEATKQGNLERIRAILGADDKLADQREESGATPLHYAALNGHRRAGEDIAGLGVKTTMKAPWGSDMTAKRSMPGTSVAGLHSLPPASMIFSI